MNLRIKHVLAGALLAVIGALHCATAAAKLAEAAYDLRAFLAAETPNQVVFVGRVIAAEPFDAGASFISAHRLTFNPLPTPSELSVLRRPVNLRAARPPIGARHRSGSGNAITERVHHIYPGSSVLPQNTSQGLLHSSHRASVCSLTGWSSGHPYLPASMGSLRASHSGAAYLGR